MYIEPFIFYYLWFMGLVPAILSGTAGVMLLRSRRVGGLTFVSLGRFGASFYVRRV
jgi:hypothetical protein